MSGWRSGGGPARVITKQNAVGQSILTASPSVPSGGTSAWAEAVASTSSDLLITSTGFCSATTTSGTPLMLQLEIGYGGSGAEVVLDTLVFTVAHPSASTFPGGWQNMAVPQRVAIGQRIAVRGTQITSWGSTHSLSVYLSTVPTANLDAS